jgi:EF hand domain-containing protein
MHNHLRQLLLFGLLAVVASFLGTLVFPTGAVAQGYSRDSRADGESRERGRRDRGGEGSRDWRGRGRDEERRGDARSSSSNSSSSSSSSTSTEPKPASTSASSPSLKTADFAKSFVREHDKDKNGWLNGDELKDLRGKPAEADLNKDGVITVEELTARLSSDTTTTTPTTSGGSGSNSNADSEHRDDRKKGDADLSKRVLYGTVYGASANGKDADKRRTYRFSKPTDHLPSGLPDWFKSKDANHDGQVSMSEYSRSWSKGTVSDFRKYDKNDDGIVTAKEVAKPENKGG